MIEIGDVLQLETKTRDAAGALADGGAVTAVVTLPTGATVNVTGQIVHTPGTGIYLVNYTTTVEGPHAVTWIVTGTNAGTYGEMFYVTGTAQALGIVSLSEVKNHLRINRTQDDEKLRDLIAEASDICESSEGTGITWRRTVVIGELHTPDDNGSITLDRTPVTSLTAITIGGQAVSVADFDVSAGILYPAAGYFTSSSRRNTVVVDYVAGGGPIPARVRGGVLEMVRYLYGSYRGGSNLPRTEEPDYTTQSGYLIPNRVKMAWQSASGTGLG